MAFEATKREWSELYTFFRLLADGSVSLGTPQVKPCTERSYSISSIDREEHDGNRKYLISGEKIIMYGLNMEQTIDRSKFDRFALSILQAIRQTGEDVVASPDGLEEFLDEIQLFNLEAKGIDRTNLSIYFWHPEAHSTGVIIRSRLSKMNPLLDGGRTANLKYELTGMKFANPMISKVNAIENQNTVVDRMLLIERLGGILKYNDVADKVFRSNLLMIDLHFPRLLAEMLRIMHLDGITRVADLTEAIKTINPLKIKDELIQKHQYYEYKMKQFLRALSTGMRPAKIYSGNSSVIQGIILINGEGRPLYYPASDTEGFEEFLFRNTRFEHGDLVKDHYGMLEKENGVLYFRLNTKVGLTKR